MTEILLKELDESPDLVKMGDGDSSCGSDSAPSEDNLDKAKMNS